MRLVDLTETQVACVEEMLNDFDEHFITFKMDGNIQIGIEENGKIIAGLDACVTAFKILYVSTVFVDEKHRRKGYGKLLIEEMEKRAKDMGINTIRLDTFSWQGKDFYEALNYKVVGSYENKIDGYSEYFFVKQLD